MEQIVKNPKENEKAKSKSKSNYKSLIKEVSKVALPISIQGLMSTLVQLVDSLFIGHLENAENIASGLNAVLNMGFVMWTIVAGIIAGIGVYFIQASGKEDRNYQKKIFISKIFWGAAWGLACILICTIFLEQITSLWVANPSSDAGKLTMKAVRDYGYIIIPSSSLQIMILIFASSFKEMKLTRLAMLVAISGIIVNSSFNYPFMYTWGMGIKGSAYSTLMARLIEVLIWLIYVFHKKPNFLPKWVDFKLIKFKEIWHVLPKSILWMVNSVAGSLAFTLQMMFLSKTSIEAGAALNTAGVIAQLVYAFTEGYTVAMGIILMQKLAKKSDTAKNLEKKFVVISFWVGIIFGAILSAICWLMFPIYPKYSMATRWQGVIMLLGISSVLWARMIKSVYISIFQGGGVTRGLIIMDGIYSWGISFALAICLIYLTPEMQIGYLYWIVTASEIFKPLVMKIYFNKRSHTFIALINAKENKKEKIEIDTL